MTVGPYDLIRHAHAIISNPEHWTQETMARDARGAPCEPDEKVAVCFCTHGAIAKAAIDLHAPGAVQRQAKHILKHQARTHLNASGIVDVNDNGDHDDVMKMFQLALDAVAETAPAS